MDLKDTLIESNATHRKGRWKKFATSVGIHGVLLALVLFLSITATHKVRANETPMPVFVQQAVAPPPPPPPPPAGNNAPQSVVKQVVQKVQPQQQPTFVQPKETPTEIPVETPATVSSDSTSSPDPAGVAGGVQGGVDGGQIGGVVGGTVGGTVGGQVGGELGGTGDAASGPLRVGGDVKAPVVSRKVDPEYTQPARSAHISGVVVVEAVIDQSGNVDDVRVLKPLPMGLSESAVTAVRGWKFKPGTLNGRAVPVIFDLTVVFSLGEQGSPTLASAKMARPAPAPPATETAPAEPPATTTEAPAPLPTPPSPPGQ